MAKQDSDLPKGAGQAGARTREAERPGLIPGPAAAPASVFAVSDVTPTSGPVSPLSGVWRAEGEGGSRGYPPPTSAEDVAKDEAHAPPRGMVAAFASPTVRLLIVILGFLGCIVVRLALHRFNFLLGYIYLTLIALTGFWFGLRGGMMAATLASAIFILEVTFYRSFPNRDVVLHTLPLRIPLYYLAGLSLGYVSVVEKRLRDKLRFLAYHDELTGCVNFRWTIQVLQTEIARSSRSGKPMTVVMLDVDHFKQINDVYGHLVGNDVLRRFAAVVKACIRAVDVVGRYGGEEFLVILPEANEDQALRVLARIRSCLDQTALASPEIYLKISAGVASHPRNGETLSQLLSSVDHALYRAKHLGRNRDVVEQRRWPRTKPSGDLHLALVLPEQKELEAMEVVNISRGGACLAFARPVPLGETICRIRLGLDDHPPVDVPAEVLYTKLDDDGRHVCGLSFRELSQETHERLLNARP